MLKKDLTFLDFHFFALHFQNVKADIFKEFNFD